MDLFKKENARLIEYESTATKETQEKQTVLGYRDMNRRFLDLEKKNLSRDAWTQKEREHIERKNKIEAAWHKDNTNEVRELSKRGVGSNKNKAFYANFTLKELEYFLKENNKGSSNSDLYNSVATDLEMYNRIMEDPLNENEAMTLLHRISESCRNYINNKSPIFAKGKIRKAIISQISDKVNHLLEEKETRITETADAKYTAFEQRSSEVSVNEACKANYDLINQVLNDNIILTKKQLAGLDQKMERILQAVSSQKVDKNQSNTMATKFFNAIGWSDHKPKIVKDMYATIKRSPLKKEMFHTINCLPQMKNARGMVKQLLGLSNGNSRQYYSNGLYGKGTYLAVSTDHKDASDEKTQNHCWEYGKRMGSMQVGLVLNGNARIIDSGSLDHLIEDKLEKLFPRVYNFLINSERSARGSGSQEALTMIAALFGYNTIKGIAGVKDVIDYYVTTDRRAMSIDDVVFERNSQDNDAASKNWIPIEHL